MQQSGLKDFVALARWVVVQVSYEPTNSSARIRMIDFKGHRFEQDIILTGVRWYLAYPLNSLFSFTCDDENGRSWTGLGDSYETN